MSKDETVYLGHMLDRARKIIAKVQGKTRADFDGDENLRLALAHLIQTIGEAAQGSRRHSRGTPRDPLEIDHGHAPQDRPRLHGHR